MSTTLISAAPHAPWSGSIFTIILFLALLGAPVGHAEEPLVGEAFSDPEWQLPMKEAWRGRPIEYDPAARGADLVVNLDQSTHPWLAPLLADYAKERGVRIKILSGTCGVTNRMFLKKRIDLGSLCCPPGREDRLPGVEFHTLGITPLAILVHPDNPAKDLPLTAIRQLFSGELRRWSELEAAAHFNRPVQPHAFLHCKRRPGHWRLLLDNEELFSTDLVTVLTIPDMIASIANNPRAVGFDMLWLATDHYRTAQGRVQTLKVDGVGPADADNLLTLRYPLYRTLNLMVWTPEAGGSALAREVLAFARQRVEARGAEYGILSAERLRAGGWRFKGSELIGEPAH